MKPFSILLIRLMGLYLLLKTLFSVLPALLGPNTGELWSAELLPVFLATVGVPVVGGVLLWCLAGRLAERLHGSSVADDDAGARVRDDDLVRAGTFLIGVYLVVRHIGMLVGVYSATGTVAHDALVVVVAGLGMMLGGGAVTAVYRRVKYFGDRR
ncbi:hypothetical protein [Halomonas icarae]|uniref:Uncharacterized protein n=1 Tax=Halomonas icarae TaxID=2691040 RepID=A0A7X4VZ77_9GAMM|nr:hypothetical protein [Halomonas icarae]MDR5901636.1 hypothetical protein [Halomonas icarae]NAW12985.1 hypothetical protein [Halomonas icarae]